MSKQKQHLQPYSETLLPTKFGSFKCMVFREAMAGQIIEHIAMVVGELAHKEHVLCRFHSECLTSEVLSSIKCDCKAQLDSSLEKIQLQGQGIVLYLRQEGRGIGLGNKIKAYALQEQGYDTVDANRELNLPDDARDYSFAINILKSLKIQSIDLLTNNPEKIKALEKQQFPVTRIPHNVKNLAAPARKYVSTKQERMNHLSN